MPEMMNINPGNIHSEKKCEKITNFEIFLVYWKQF